jgi:hypothetical protein
MGSEAGIPMTGHLHEECPGLLLEPPHHCGTDVFTESKSMALQSFLMGLNMVRLDSLTYINLILKANLLLLQILACSYTHEQKLTVINGRRRYADSHCCDNFRPRKNTSYL